MARRRSETLTEGEQRLMEVIWKRGNATVAEVLEALPRRNRPAFNSVQTTLRIMEKKGYIGHDEQGRAFSYFAKVARDDAAIAAVRSVIGRFFDNTKGTLALRLLESDGMSETELRRLQKQIDEADA